MCDGVALDDDGVRREGRGQRVSTRALGPLSVVRHVRVEVVKDHHSRVGFHAFEGLLLFEAFLDLGFSALYIG